MPSGNATRKARRVPIKKTTLWVLHSKKGFSFTIHYYDSKSTTEGGKTITHTLDKHKKIYEIIEDNGWSDNRRLIVRRADNHATVLDIPQPSTMSGDSFTDDGQWWLPGASGPARSISNSFVFHESEGDITYVGHQIFTFKLLEKIPNSVANYHVHLTPSGVVRPYIVGKKYVYSLRDKVAVPLKSLHLDPKKYMNEQLKDVDAKFKTAPTIPFPVEMIDAGL